MPDPRALATDLEEADVGGYEALLMPDFFLDHLMRFAKLDEVADALQSPESRNFDVPPQRQLLRPGGGATRIAHALARMGVRARLMCATSPVGRLFLQGTLGRDGVDLSLVRDDGPLHVTGAIEADDCSVMLYTPQHHTGLAPETLGDAEWDAVASVDAVYVGNWTNPRAHDLAAEVWRVAKQNNAITFTDAGLPPSGPERERLVDSICSRHLDACSVNAEELCAYGGADDVVTAGEVLSRRTRARIDLHSNDMTASFVAGDLVATAPRFPTKHHQATGAGDTWNAGNLLGDMLGLPDEDRLMLANALVAIYVSAERAEPPSFVELVRFLRRPEAAKIAREA